MGRSIEDKTERDNSEHDDRQQNPLNSNIGEQHYRTKSEDHDRRRKGHASGGARRRGDDNDDNDNDDNDNDDIQDSSNSTSDDSADDHKREGKRSKKRKKYRSKDDEQRKRRHKKSFSHKRQKKQHTAGLRRHRHHQNENSSSFDSESEFSRSSQSSKSEDDSRCSRSSGDKRSHRKENKKKKHHNGNRHLTKATFNTATAVAINNSNSHPTERLLAKLSARGETLEERKERRAQKRAAHIAAKFGYTAESNPFHDPNLHEAFTWKKKQEKQGIEAAVANTAAVGNKHTTMEDSLAEIEKVRQRRQDRDLQREEMERIRAEESRMKELENYDDWARKEEEFHLQQQRQRSAIRLVEGREKPIDLLAKNLLLFGLSSVEEQQRRASVKYKEKYNAMDVLETLESELEEPHELLSMLKLEELEELLLDIETFYNLELEAMDPMSSISGAAQGENSNNNQQEATQTILKYWGNLRLVARDEIQFLKNGGKNGPRAKTVTEIKRIFQGQSIVDLLKMKEEVDAKMYRYDVEQGEFDPNKTSTASEARTGYDRDYWQSVSDQLAVQLAKMELSELHSEMLVRQLERLEMKREELSRQPPPTDTDVRQPDVQHDQAQSAGDGHEERDPAMPNNVAPGFGDLEEELGLSSEIDLRRRQPYQWEDKYRPRKPRYFNRVKTGYDWNKYNQTHYDKDNPPPKTVQGYRFEIFYPDLIDQSQTPQFFLEPAGDNDDFCIIRFHAGPPYEDIAFKIVNRAWNRSRKRGYICKFERGVLSLHFNFQTHWYRR